MKQQILFRADASAQIGYGHFVRSLALADMLKEDFDCVFYTADPSPYQIEEMQKVCAFVPISDSTKIEDFLACLTGVETVVLDNYFYSEEYQKQIKNKGCKLVCIDDMHDRHYYADVVINHALTETSLFDVESYTRLCLGFDFALLRSPFLKPIPNIKRNNNLIVNFGAADSYHITDKVVGILLQLKLPYHIIVILGDKTPFSETFRDKVEVRKNLTAEQMARLFQESAAGFLAASTVSIEAISRGLPIIIGYCVDNQEDYCKTLSANGNAISVGVLQDVDCDNLKKAFLQLESFVPKCFNSNEIKSRYINVFKQLNDYESE